MDSTILHRFRRATNTTSSSSSSEEDNIFSDANKLAMYVVVPILFIVYGGCACIYCCYRCRQYFKDNQPLEIIKLKVQSLTSNNRKNKAEDLFKSDKVPTSAHSSPGVSRKFDRDLRSTASTPALHYGIRQTPTHGGETSNGNTIGIEDLDNANFQEDDSGIQGDSVLTDASPTSYLIERFVSEIPTKQVTVLPYAGRSIEAEGGNSVYYDKTDNQKRIFTVDAETQTDVESKQITRTSTNVSSRYLDWLGRSRSIKKTESREMLLHSKNDNTVSPYGSNQVPRNADAPFQIYGAFLAGTRNSKAHFKQTKQTPPDSEYSYVSKSSSRKNRKEILDEDMKQFIISPWK